VGSKSFVELFVVKAFHKDLRMIYSLFMLVDPQAAFVTFSLYYAQHLGYLFHIMFQSLGIL